MLCKNDKNQKFHQVLNEILNIVYDIRVIDSRDLKNQIIKANLECAVF